MNYPLEYREIGFNEKLKEVIESNGGRVYNEDDVEGLLLLVRRLKDYRKERPVIEENQPRTAQVAE